MKRAWLVAIPAAVVAVVAVVALSPEDRPGDAAVYEQIEASTDCGELRQGLERNEADAQRRYSKRATDPMYDVVKSYAEVYEDRISEVC